jgi:thioredoxin 1
MITVKRFTADWCQPCKMLAPIIEQVKQELTGVNFEVYNVDQFAALVTEYGIKSVPTLIIEKDGEIVQRLTGLTTKGSLISTLNSFK